MLIGAHTVLYSSNPNADRAFFREMLKLAGVDTGGGFMIFGLPAAEVSVHESGSPGSHELFLMCDDVQAFIGEMSKGNVACAPVKDEGWGTVTQITLPGRGKLSVYQPRHARPSAARAKPKNSLKRSKLAKKATKKRIRRRV